MPKSMHFPIRALVAESQRELVTPDAPFVCVPGLEVRVWAVLEEEQLVVNLRVCNRGLVCQLRRGAGLLLSEIGNPVYAQN